MRWGDRYLSDEPGPPLYLTHDTCGTPVDQAFICWQCDQTVTPSQLRSRPGPGARQSA
jgi:hypothetical protein